MTSLRDVAALWEHANIEATAADPATQGEGAAVFVETVLLLDVPINDVMHRLGTLIVKATSEAAYESTSTTFEAGAVLLPATHMLLKGAGTASQCTVRVLTDNHRAVPYLEALLQAPVVQTST